MHIEMIFDRTNIDVAQAQKIRQNMQKKIASGIDYTSILSETDIKTLERGCFTKNTINRVNNAIKLIKNKLLSEGYIANPDSIVISEPVDFPYIFKKQDFNRFLINLNNFKRSIVLFPSTPSTPTKPEYTISTANAIERILYDIDTTFQNLTNVNNTYYSDEIFCDEI